MQIRIPLCFLMFRKWLRRVNDKLFTHPEYNGIERTGDCMFKTIPISEVDHYIDNQYDMVLIDLRNSASYERAHISGAVNIPYEEIEQRVSELPRNKVLVFYCSRGGQSMMVCRYLARMGYSVVDVAGGMAYYRGKYLVRG